MTQSGLGWGFLFEYLQSQKLYPMYGNIFIYSNFFLVGVEQSDALGIVRKVGALPLALNQAGSYISARQIPFSKYLLRFESAFVEVTTKKPPTVVWQYRDDTVFTTWEVSFNALGYAAQELLLLFGFLDSESIPEELIPLERLNKEFRISEFPFLFHLVTGLRLDPNCEPYRLS